ncbi:MAG: hypothetical protein U0T79_09775 [Ferruginibacter sp.]|mgnify:CR=1 FL=1|nr:hypothetical protein [Chitinophagales bacterium]
MKKMITFLVLAAGVVALYLLTGSWKLALISAVVCLGYLAWLVRFELGIGGSQEDARHIQEKSKKDHEKRTTGNPTLR